MRESVRLKIPDLRDYVTMRANLIKTQRKIGYGEVKYAIRHRKR